MESKSVSARSTWSDDEKGQVVSVDTFEFGQAYLDALAEKHAGEFAAAEPFPHVVIDDFLPADVAHRIIDEFPPFEAEDLSLYTAPNESRAGKSASLDVDELSPFVRNILRSLNQKRVVEFIEKLTEIDHLIADPHFLGGGTHQSKRGGYLKVHADFNWHPQLLLDRRLNLILFLNPKWESEYGGQLEFWDTEMTEAKASYLPLFNRMVIFYTSDDSYHGHPDPLECPEDVTRRSLALYYYTNGRPLTERSLPHSTKYKRRPGEEFARRTMLSSTRILKRVVPPIFIDAVNYLKIATRNLDD